MSQDLWDEFAHFEDGDVFADAGAGAGTKLLVRARDVRVTGRRYRLRYGREKETPIRRKSFWVERERGGKEEMTNCEETSFHRFHLLRVGFEPALGTEEVGVFAVYGLVHVHDWRRDADVGAAGQLDAADRGALRRDVSLKGICNTRVQAHGFFHDGLPGAACVSRAVFAV